MYSYINRDHISKENTCLQLFVGKSSLYTFTYIFITALLLLYDVTNKVSFDNIRAWLVEIREYAQEDVVIMLLGRLNISTKCFQLAVYQPKLDIQSVWWFVFPGNKADCPDRQVKREDGERLAREYNVAFMETSAKTGLNVELAFLAIARYNGF